ncbi:MAG: DUF4442 domain-containing protein [Myxococcales bacterium]|nr:DUF4442 domain-containing protein [Myxococcales bacterium]
MPKLESPTTLVRTTWDRLGATVVGRAVFDRMIRRTVPYTGTIRARVQEVRAGYARVELPDRRRVRNHLDSVHAIALCNLAEMTGNLAMIYTLPPDARLIVSGMSIEYRKKARGTITATSETPPLHGSAEHTYEVPVRMVDATGALVAEATLRSLVRPRPA